MIVRYCCPFSLFYFKSPYTQACFLSPLYYLSDTRSLHEDFVIHFDNTLARATPEYGQFAYFSSLYWLPHSSVINTLQFLHGCISHNYTLLNFLLCCNKLHLYRLRTGTLHNKVMYCIQLREDASCALHRKKFTRAHTRRENCRVCFNTRMSLCWYSIQASPGMSVPKCPTRISFNIMISSWLDFPS